MRLVPDVFFGAIHPVPFKKNNVFFLEGLFPVMGLLILNVSDGVGQMRHAYTEGSIARLPCETFLLRECLFDP
jgi:hypothetical protein